MLQQASFSPNEIPFGESQIWIDILNEALIAQVWPIEPSTSVQ